MFFQSSTGKKLYIIKIPPRRLLALSLWHLRDAAELPPTGRNSQSSTVRGSYMIWIAVLPQSTTRRPSPPRAPRGATKVRQEARFAASWGYFWRTFALSRARSPCTHLAYNCHGRSRPRQMYARRHPPLVFLSVCMLQLSVCFVCVLA